MLYHTLARSIRRALDSYISVLVVFSLSRSGITQPRQTHIASTSQAHVSDREPVLSCVQLTDQPRTTIALVSLSISNIGFVNFTLLGSRLQVCGDVVSTFEHELQK